ncbi:hypothetical protein ABBQ32_010515 [Trebouxia sp. C0010 RCD-2024]
MARRGTRQSRPSAKREIVTNTRDESDEAPLATRTAKQNNAPANVVAVRTSPRRPLRAASKSQASQALQRLTALREQRQSKVSANKTPSATLDAAPSDSPVADLMDNVATQTLPKIQGGALGKCGEVSSMIHSPDSASENEAPGPKPAVGRGQKRKVWQESLPSSDAVPAAKLPVPQGRQRRQSYQSREAAQRQRSQKFIAGGDRRSLSGSDESDLDDLIASEDDAQDLGQSGKQRISKSGRKRRSIKEKLGWSDSCSEDSSNIGEANGCFQKPQHVHQDTAEPVDRQHAQTVAEIAAAPVVGEDEDNPQPAKRHRQVSNIIGYEDDWDTATVQAHTSSKGKQLKHKQLQEQLEDNSDDSDQPTAGQKQRLSKAGSQDIQDVATTPAAKRKRDVLSDDDHKASIQPRRSSRRHAVGGDNSTEHQPGPPNVAQLLAEEGLDPIKEDTEGTQLAGRRKPSKVGIGSIRDRMQQNQQRLHAQGSKQSRKSPAASFLRDQVYEWHGDRMVAPSDSDSESSSSQAPSDSQTDQASQDCDGNSEHDSDLGDFIVEDDPAADARGPDEGGMEPGPSATAVSALLEEAGMVSSCTDKDHFTIYIEYLVYDLVDNTFAVRVMGSSRLRKHFDVAVRHVEESLAFKRDSCATSSAWMNAVPGFLDKVDTYPGLSSDWAAKESSMEDLHEGVCQACQRSFTVGHASKRLTLKGRPYKQVWQYGFR